MDDPASLRAVEAEIDGEYRRNRLMTHPRGQVWWALLSSMEEWSIAPLVSGKQRSLHEHGAGVDSLINVLKYALRWVKSSCGESDELHDPTRRFVIRPLTTLSTLHGSTMPSRQYSATGATMSSNWSLTAIA